MSEADHLATARAALQLERRAALRPTEVRVDAARAVVGAEEQGVWRLVVHADTPLDEDGSWVGSTIERQLQDAVSGETTPPWRAEILEVDADEDALYVAADAPWPGPGHCRIWPFDFLSAPATVLDEPALAFLHARLATTLAHAAGAPPSRPAPGPEGLLPAWSHDWCLLWGPPGTGKTHTIVEQVCALLTDPAERVLVVSTTNRATDEVALRLGARLRRKGRSLDGLWRMGRVVRAEDYRTAGLDAVLPPETGPLLDALAKANLGWRDASHPADRTAWARHIQELQRKLPSLASRATDPQARCLIATLHAGQRALVHRDVVSALRDEGPPFTTVILDEAGLVPRALAATVALLASRRVVLVGDPRQLSPIARATRSMPPEVMTWVARSGLDHLSDPVAAAAPHVHRLDVQRRMHPAIRAVVSALSYSGRLTDGPGIAARTWSGAGTLGQLPRAAWYVLDAHHPDRPAEAASRRGPRGRSRMRPAGVDVLDALLVAQPELRTQRSVLLVSPFRAQRDLFRGWILAQRLDGWRASTVHAQQGAEAELVIVDTVHASSTSWPAEEWVRLVNVGMSRARQWMLLIASRAEMAQPFLRPVRTALPARVLAPRGDHRVWTTLDATGHAPVDDTDLFAGPVAAEPDLASLADGPLPDGAALGAQLARRQRLRPVLSQEQARLVHRDLSDAGPRLVRGVAGSGKTLVLAHWAVRALRGLGIPTVTIVVANRALQPLVQAMIDEAWREAEGDASHVPWERIDIRHAAELLAGMLQERGLPAPGSPEGDDRFDYEAQAGRLLSSGSVAPRFDAAFLDEAQDLGHATLRLLVQLVRPGADALRPVLIFFDNAQNVYGRGTPRWTDLGLDLRGRSDVMRESFRGTRPCTELALGVLDRLQPLEQDPDLRELMRPAREGDAPLLEREGQGARRRWHAHFCGIDGQPPHVRCFDDRAEEVRYVTAQIIRWVQHEGVRPGDVCVLSNDPGLREVLATALRHSHVPTAIQTSQGFVGLGAVAVTTAHSFKGYDAEIVVVVGADTFATSRGPLPAPLYVAMTRARTAMLVTATRQPPASPGGRVVEALLGAVDALSASPHDDAALSRSPPPPGSAP